MAWMHCRVLAQSEVAVHVHLSQCARSLFTQISHYDCQLFNFTGISMCNGQFSDEVNSS